MFAVYIPRLLKSLIYGDNPSAAAQTDAAQQFDEFGDPIGTDAPIDPAISRRFHSAANFLPRVMDSLSREDLIEFYGLYKQATAGPADPSQRPSMLDLKGRKKFDSWANLGDMTKTDAMTTYASRMQALDLGWDGCAKEGPQGYGMRPSRPAASTSETSNDDLLVQDPESALWFAASKADDVETMERIFKRRPEILHETDQHLGMTALHWAIDSGCDRAIRFLLEHGSDVDATDPDGNTPLHFAAYCHRTEAAELLLSKGAGTSLVNAEGKTAAESCLDEPTLHHLLDTHARSQNIHV